MIGSDKSGFTLKEAVKRYLTDCGQTVADVGTLSVDDAQPFYAVAPAAAQMIQSKEAELGVLICGTGMGMSQVANKFPGVLAACCESEYGARMSRAINNSNILCMGGWIIAPELGVKMVECFLHTGHTEGVEPWRAEFLKDAFVQVREIDEACRGA
ncbi:MAG: RpiB/LacA/LacB family sugar-phosphate isomerase [Eubacteriales bacterium]|nr:RpiB/LacA/LacB family sugar-phosphate isomerase [Eubacteriales bacterium]